MKLEYSYFCYVLLTQKSDIFAKYKYILKI